MLVAKKVGENDVYIVVFDQSEPVGTEHVEKFDSDMLGLHASGILISIDSDIVGRPHFELVHLSNGKFTMYLSNNNFDTNIIAETLMLIYGMDGGARGVVR